MTRRKRHKSQPEKRPEIRLRLALHEDRPGDTAPSIADFANVCAALRTTLNYLCHDLTNKDVEFEVCDLVTGSAEMAVRPRPGIVSDEVARDLTFTYQATMESIEDDKPLDARLADRTIRAFAAYSSSIKKEGASLYFGSKRLSDHYIANIESLTEPIKPSLGSVSGKLEGLNVHGELRFTLYPAYQGEEIECRVDKSQQDRVLDLVGRKVTAHGTLHYVRSQVLPKSVDVEEFTEEPPDDQLPTLLDAKGTLSKSNRGGSRSGW